MFGPGWIESGLHAALHLDQRTEGRCGDRGIQEFTWKCVYDSHIAPKHRKMLWFKGMFKVSNEGDYRVRLEKAMAAFRSICPVLDQRCMTVELMLIQVPSGELGYLSLTSRPH